MNRPAETVSPRRFFSRISLSVGCFLFLLCGCNRPSAEATPERRERTSDTAGRAPIQVFQKAVPAMGTVFTFSVAVTGEDTEAVKTAVDAASSEILRVEQMMSTYIENSPISRVNRSAGTEPVSVPDELVRMIDEANDVSRRTEGKFDISFGAVGRLWDFKGVPPRLPDKTALAAARELVDFHSVVTDKDAHTVFLKKKGMSIGLGAIAKGYGVDRASAVLVAHGFTDFIMYGGGDIYISGNKGGAPWRVGIQDPRNREKYFADFDMPSQGAVVTSGDYEKFFILDGRRFHHIIDPASGFPARGVVSVTIFAKSAALADALATGVFVLGIEKGMRLIESDPSLEGILVDDALVPHISSGLKGRATVRPITGSNEVAP